MSTNAVLEFVPCIQCKTPKEQTKFRVFRNKRRKTCMSCEQANEREVQTRNIRKTGRGQDIVGDLCECSACLEVKSISEFNRRKTSKDGFSNKCTSCTRDNRPVAVRVVDTVGVNVDKVVATGQTIPVKTIEPAPVKEDVGFSDVIDDGKDIVDDVKEIIEDVQEAKEEILSFWTKLKLFWKGLTKKWT